jgi:hypothetical protein
MQTENRSHTGAHSSAVTDMGRSREAQAQAQAYNTIVYKNILKEWNQTSKISICIFVGIRLYTIKNVRCR